MAKPTPRPTPSPATPGAPSGSPRYGLRVLRFSNREIMGNLDGVLAVIAATLEDPHPGPLPEGEGVLPPLPPGEGRGEGAARP